MRSGLRGSLKTLRSPFCLYLTVTLGLNIPPIIFAGHAFAINNGCSLAIKWLLVNAVLCVVNMAAAIYISGKISYDPADTEANETTNNDAPPPDIEATAGENNNKPKTPEKKQSSRQGRTGRGHYLRYRTIELKACPESVMFCATTPLLQSTL